MAVEKSQGLTKKQKQARLFGWLIFIGMFWIVIAILAVIPVTPYTTYKNQAAGIRLKYPAAWKMIEHPDNTPGAIVAFLAPQQTAMDTYAESVNISFQNLEANPMSLGQFTQLAIRQFTGTFIKDIEIVESDSTQLAGQPAYRFSYVAKIPDAPFKLMHVWVLDGTKAYIFTYGATEKDFDVFRGEVETMLKSFRIL